MSQSVEAQQLSSIMYAFMASLARHAASERSVSDDRAVMNRNYMGEADDLDMFSPDVLLRLPCTPIT